MPFLRGLLWALAGLGLASAGFDVVVYGDENTSGAPATLYALLAIALYLSKQVEVREDEK